MVSLYQTVSVPTIPTLNPHSHRGVSRLILRMIGDWEHNLEGQDCICVPRIIEIEGTEDSVVSHNTFCFLPADKVLENDIRSSN